MEYNKIIAVTGLTGLFELIASKADGAILKSLTDKTSKFISSRVHQFTQLNTIEIYTTGENVNMVDIFSAMQKSKEALPDVKNNEAVKKYFEKVYPAMDFERVYTSDMKKIVKWFDQLTANNIEMKLDEVEEETATAEPVLEEVVEKVEEAPKKATRKKKAE
jgi:hypothetical protein